jgi:hypothetical protein
MLDNPSSPHTPLDGTPHPTLDSPIVMIKRRETSLPLDGEEQGDGVTDHLPK